MWTNAQASYIDNSIWILYWFLTWQFRQTLQYIINTRGPQHHSTKPHKSSICSRKINQIKLEFIGPTKSISQYCTRMKPSETILVRYRSLQSYFKIVWCTLSCTIVHLLTMVSMGFRKRYFMRMKCCRYINTSVLGKAATNIIVKYKTCDWDTDSEILRFLEWILCTTNLTQL